MVGHRLGVVSLLVAAALILAALPARAELEHRFALVIGNGKYAGDNRLINPINDAEDMCKALRRVGFQTSCHNEVRTRAEFLVRLEEWAQRLTPTSKGLFYYAGHAVQIGGENYLVPIDANVHSLADVPEVLISLGQILRRLKKTNNAFNMVILDACRNNPYAGAVTGGSRALSVIANRSPNSTPAPSPLANEVVYGLGRIIDGPVGSIVLYATGSDEVASDGRGRNGPLTKHLLEHLETPGITVEEMIKRVTLGMEKETQRPNGRRQAPFLYSSFSGEFCFASCPPKFDAIEIERLRKERADFEKQLKERPAEPRKEGPRVFVPPSL